MIDIYTEKIDSKDWIIKNDLFFNLNTSNEEMSDNIDTRQAYRNQVWIGNYP